MKITTWNVNSLRARIENIKKYLKFSSPDVVLLQEIKTEEQNYPFDDLKKLGYISYVNGQKSYNGVAFLSKKKIENIVPNPNVSKNYFSYKSNSYFTLKKIFVLIFLGLISSIVLSNYYIIKYDKYRDDGYSHVMLKDETARIWYKAARIIEDVKKGKNFFIPNFAHNRL